MQAFPTHRINTGKTCRNSFQRKLYFQKKQFATQNGKYPQKTSGVQEMVLRNIAPREGTERRFTEYAQERVKIKKYSSPRGDGKFSSLSIGLKFSKLRNIAPREGTERINNLFTRHVFTLRNIAPREGTERVLKLDKESGEMIKKYSSPRGDGNKIAEVTLLIRLILRNIAPREGTETFLIALPVLSDVY